MPALVSGSSSITRFIHIKLTVLLILKWWNTYIKIKKFTFLLWKKITYEIDEWKTVLKKWKRKHRNTRFNYLFCKGFSYLKRNKKLLCYLGQVSIFICTQNVILTFFSQPTHQTMKTSNIEHIKFIRNTKPFVTRDTLKMFCFLISIASMLPVF